MMRRALLVLAASFALLAGCNRDHSPAALCDHLEQEAPSRASERSDCIRDKEALQRTLSHDQYEEYADCWMSADTEVDFFGCAQDANQHLPH